jgi:hypothetical protein
LFKNVKKKFFNPVKFLFDKNKYSFYTLIRHKIFERKKMNTWVFYNNGNYKVALNKVNGTKIRYNNSRDLIPIRPESIDVKITNQCNYQCLFCHEGSVPSGKQASYENMKKFIQSVEPYTEIAVGGGSLMVDYKHTEFFLKGLQRKQAIPSITVHQKDFIKYIDIIKQWYNQKLIYGVGVSLEDSSDKELHKALKEIPTAIIHVIAGIFSQEDFDLLKEKNYKLLILGFKSFRRGRKYFSIYKQQIDNNIQWLSKQISEIDLKYFNTIAFDNLALEQLKIQDNFNSTYWSRVFMGEEGQFTFYIDLVEQIYAQNSHSSQRFAIKEWNIRKMFMHIRYSNIIDYIKKENINIEKNKNNNFYFQDNVKIFTNNKE